MQDRAGVVEGEESNAGENLSVLTRSADDDGVSVTTRILRVGGCVMTRGDFESHSDKASCEFCRGNNYFLIAVV